MRTEKKRAVLEQWRQQGLPALVTMNSGTEYRGRVDWVGELSFDLTGQHGLALAEVSMIHLDLVPSET